MVRPAKDNPRKHNLYFFLVINATVAQVNVALSLPENASSHFLMDPKEQCIALGMFLFLYSCHLFVKDNVPRLFEEIGCESHKV